MLHFSEDISDKLKSCGNVRVDEEGKILSYPCCSLVWWLSPKKELQSLVVFGPGPWKCSCPGTEPDCRKRRGQVEVLLCVYSIDVLNTGCLALVSN